MKDYDDEFNRLNTANTFFIVSSAQYSDNLLEDIKNIEGINEAEMQKGIMLNVPVSMEGSIQEQNQIFYNVDDE